MRDCLFIVAGAIMMGSLPVFVRNLHINPVEISFFRLLSGFIFISLFIILMKEKPEIRNWRLVILITIINTATIVLYIASIQLTKAATAALLLYMAPVYTVPLSILAGEDVGVGGYVSLLFGLLGLLLVISPNKFSKGDIFGFFAGICYALYFILMKKARLEMTSIDITFAYLALSSAMLSPAITFGLPPPSSLPWIAGLGLIPTAIAFILFNHGIKGCGAGKSSISALIEPVSAGFFGYIFFGEVLSPKQLAGGALIISAVAFLFLHEQNSK
ncbi:MAG: permease [Archaeoglobus sp.]|nr:MAG: permease [Archaeoglobus sp.]